MTSLRAFINGFLIGLLIFFLANGIAAQLLSDCGLPAVLGISACADDIVRVGFPLIFRERGGFAYHDIFNPTYLLVDLFIGFDFSVTCGIVAHWLVRRKENRPKD